MIKFIYSEKATNFCEISTVDLSYVVTVEISQNFVSFTEYMNFKITLYVTSKQGERFFQIFVAFSEYLNIKSDRIFYPSATFKFPIHLIPDGILRK